MLYPLPLRKSAAVDPGDMYYHGRSFINSTAKTRSDRDFEMSLCYTPEAFSCLEETKYNINHCLELASSFPKMYNITMF